MPSPVALRPDNFTPPSRTPWGGTRMLDRYKPTVARAHAIVGESWEISVEPSFPSVTRDGDRLDARIAADPVGWLGRSAVERFGPQTPLLVKLLDAADHLSVQVHPADGDPALAAGESGKPEAWIVLDAAPGAGLYLGFRDGVGRDDVAACLATGGDVAALMNFVAVAPGEAYVIAAGTPHAIGAGCTLLEPQFVRPGQRGVTYRFWDWNRRYDSAGRRSPSGQPRSLHVERSMAVTAWEGPRGDAFVESCRPSRRVLSDGSVTREHVVDWPWFQVERWSGSGTAVVPAVDAMWALTCVGGRARVQTAAGEVAIGCGESAAIPASAGEVGLQLESGDVLAVRT